jgi:hypothetical protein
MVSCKHYLLYYTDQQLLHGAVLLLQETSCRAKTNASSPAQMDIKSIVAGAMPSGTRTFRSGNTSSTSSDCCISDIACSETPLMTMACTPELLLLLLLLDCWASTAAVLDSAAASALPVLDAASEAAPMILQPNLLSLAVATAASEVRPLMRWMSLQHEHEAACPDDAVISSKKLLIRGPELYGDAETGSHCIVSTLPWLTLRTQRTCCLRVQLHLQ